MKIKTFVIDARVEYQEVLMDQEYVNKYYQVQCNDDAFMMSTIPDGCVDLQFVLTEQGISIFACGSCLQSNRCCFAQYPVFFGVKFQPGCIPVAVRPYVLELIGDRMELVGYDWLNRLGSDLLKAESFEERVKCFEAAFPFQRQFTELNPIVSHAIERITEANGNITISTLADDLQYNQRYIDRVFRKTTGLSMKEFSGIIRIQNAILYLQSNREDEIYEKLGYYDQSYFIKKFKRYTSLTPREFCRRVGRKIV